jgi:hypothetical protein
MIQLDHLLSDRDSYPYPCDEVYGTTSSDQSVNDGEPVEITPLNSMAGPDILVFAPEIRWYDVKIVGLIPVSQYQWASKKGGESSKAWTCKYVISGEEDASMNSADLAAVSISSFYDVDKPASKSFRGIFPTLQQRLILHSENVEIDISKLRQWKPKIQINYNRLPSEDE